MVKLVCFIHAISLTDWSISRQYHRLHYTGSGQFAQASNHLLVRDVVVVLEVVR